MFEAYSDSKPDEHPGELYSDAIQDGERDCFACGTTVFSNPCEKCGGETTIPPPARYFDGMGSNFPELGGNFPDPVYTAAVRPFSDALLLFPSVEGNPQINFASIREFSEYFDLPDDDVAAYVEILRDGLIAFSDGRRKGISHRISHRMDKKKRK